MPLEQFNHQDLEGISAALNAHGACVVRDAISVDMANGLLTDFQPHLGEQRWGADDLGYREAFYGTQTKRLHGLFTKSALMCELLMHPCFLSIARQLLVVSGVAKDIRLSNAELMVLGEGQGVQTLHTDAASWAAAQTRFAEEILVSANVALTPFTSDNGATRVVPGSHRWPQDREPQAEEICLATMPQGAALLYVGNVVHSGGANRTSEPRVGLYLGYVASWLRPLENQLVTNAPQDILSLPEAAQRMLDVSAGGFTVYA